MERVTIGLRPWSQDDLPLLERANTVDMTTHLGGPETHEQLEARNENYLRLWREGAARMFVIEDDGEPVGGIGWCETEWRGRPIHETGWFTLPESQGRRFAQAAIAMVLEDARHHHRFPVLAAFPSVTNLPSNALCRRAGFVNRGTEEFPFRGVVLKVNAWTIDLSEPG